MRLTSLLAVILCAAIISPVAFAQELPPLTKGIEYANPENQHLQLDLAQPSGDGPFPAVVCIHGGGFRAGKRDGWDTMCRQLASRGYVAITITYRLAPDHQFPAAVEDSKAAVRWLRANAAKYHVDTNRIGALGDSAGAHLALYLAVTNNVHDFDGDQNPGQSTAVQCAVSYYGPADFTLSYGRSVDAAEVLPLFLGGNLQQQPSRPRAREPALLGNAGRAADPAAARHQR